MNQQERSSLVRSEQSSNSTNDTGDSEAIESETTSIVSGIVPGRAGARRA